jgi:hypothetical protein
LDFYNAKAEKGYPKFEFLRIRWANLRAKTFLFLGQIVWIIDKILEMGLKGWA